MASDKAPLSVKATPVSNVLSEEAAQHMTSGGRILSVKNDTPPTVQAALLEKAKTRWRYLCRGRGFECTGHPSGVSCSRTLAVCLHCQSARLPVATLGWGCVSSGFSGADDGVPVAAVLPLYTLLEPGGGRRSLQDLQLQNPVRCHAVSCLPVHILD